MASLSSLPQLLHSPRVRVALLYTLLLAGLRADFLWRLDRTGVYWRAAGISLPAGFLQDLGVALLLGSLIGLSAPAGRVARWICAGMLGTFVGLTAINLVTLAALSVPAQWSMATYLGDLFTAPDLVSPVDIPTGLMRLGGSLVLFGFGWRWAAGPERERTLPRWRRWGPALVGLTLCLLSRPLTWLDHRAGQVAHADGASWLLQSGGTSFATHADVDPVPALLTPAARTGQVPVSPRYPLARATPWAACRTGLLSKGCEVDADRDGHSLARDCRDDDPTIHPGVRDLPRDGRDQDCDGLDAEAPDVLILQLEGMPARILPATGGDDPTVAPELAALVRRPDARLFTRYETAGTQTARGFVSALCSLLPHWGAMITRDYPKLGVRCLPAVLAEVGFSSRFVQNGNPEFDRQGPFAKHMGFQRIEGLEEIARATGDPHRVTHWGLADATLFRHLATVLKDQRSGAKPLLLTAQTITNHYPYVVPGHEHGPDDDEPEGPIWDKLRATSRYVDGALGQFIREIDAFQAQPGQRPLLVVLAGDHGHASELHPGNAMPTAGLYAENVHTPLVFWAPGHPELLRALQAADRDQPASSVDLMPTLLGLLGVEPVHAMMGRDLARPTAAEDLRALSINPMAGGLIRVRTPAATVIARASPPGLELYDTADLQEQTDLADERAAEARTAAEGAIAAVMAARRLIETDRLWSDSLLRSVDRKLR